MSIPKKRKKIVFWIAIMLISALVLIVFGETPWSAEIAFRRAERKNLIGPAEILEILDFEDSRYDHLLIAESDYGYTFYEWQDRDAIKYYAKLHYQPKAERVTLYCTSDGYESLYTGKEWLPIFAFAEHSAAVSARLTLQIDQADGSVTYELQAERSPSGYFLFRLKTADLGAEDFWMIQQLITGEYSEYILDGTATATVQLYDKTGNLVETKSFSK